MNCFRQQYLKFHCGSTRERKGAQFWKIAYFRRIFVYESVVSMATSISAEDVQRLLKYDDLIPIIENCLANFSKHEKSGVVMPVRSTVDVNQGNGYINNILA